MWDDEQIDAAIDETARQMTAGEPGADFRARVIARIELRPRRASLWRPIAAAVAVAAILLVAVLIRPKPNAPEVPLKAEAPAVRLKPSATDEAKHEPALIRLTPDPTHEGVAQGGSPAIASNDLEPLSTPGLELESIAVATLATGDTIDIDPLPPVPSIALTPLDVDNEGVRQ